MAFTSANDINILQSSDSAVVGAGAGNDTYVLSPSTLSANQEITISDTQGTNKLQLIGGLTIASSVVAMDTVQLTLSNGAKVTVLGASTFSYEVGGNPLTATTGTVQTYAQFATTTLGAASVPTTATATATGTANVTIAGGSTGTTAGQAFTLTTAAEVKTLTAGNDTVDGSALNSLSGDTIVDGSTTDADTLSATIDLSSSVTKPVISNVEAVAINNKFGSTANTLDVSGISGGTVTLSSAFGTAIKVGGGGGAAGAVYSGAQNAALTIGSGLTTVTVEDITANPTINTSSAVTSLTLKGAAAGSANSNTDAVTVKLAGNANLTITNTDDATTDVDTLNLVSQTGANKVKLVASGNGSFLTANSESVAVTGDKDLTIYGQVDGTTPGNNALAGATITNGLTGGAKLTAVLTGALVAATVQDLSKIGASTIQIGKDIDGTTAPSAAAGLTFKLANSGVTFDFASSLTKSVTLNAASGSTNTLDLTASGGALAATDVITTTGYSTVNYHSNAAQTLTSADFGASTTVNIDGAKNITFATALNAAKVDATNLTGNLTVVMDAAKVTNATGGSGSDVFTMLTATDATITGGSGTDTLKFGGALDVSGKSISLTGIESIDLNNNSVTANQNLVTGKTLNLMSTGGAKVLTINQSSLLGSSVDLSNISGDSTTASTAINGTTGSDVIKGSALVDVITGGQGADTIDLAAGGADIVAYANANEYGDTVTGFLAGTATGNDKVQFAKALASSADTAWDVATAPSVLSGVITKATMAVETTEGLLVSAAVNAAATNKVIGTALNDLTTVAKLLGDTVTVTDAGAVATARTVLFAVEASDATTSAEKFAVYSWTQAAATDVAIDSAELTLVGVYSGTGAVATSNIVLV